MSGTVTPPTPVAPAQEQLVTPQTIIALIGMMIVAGTVMAVFWRGTSDNVSMAIGFVFGSMGSGIVGFYFGSSKGSQGKDAVIAAQAGVQPTAPGTTSTTTTATPPATVPGTTIPPVAVVNTGTVAP